jgi:hypothetical protein
MAGAEQDINPTLLPETGRRAECLPAFRTVLDRAARPFRTRALGRLIVVAAGALAAAATAADASGASGRLDRPSRSEIARAGTIADSTLTPAGQARLARSSWWGGVYTAATGEQVSVYASSTYPQDAAVGQRWADFLASLVHGKELPTIKAFLAPLNEVQGLCGPQALACYNPGDSTLVAPGEDPYFDTSAEAVVTHEYGHHIANNRNNAPWRAEDWGAKRWASYLQVCRNTKQSVFFPGVESRPNYAFNPGEGWAEAYRVLNQRKTGVAETPWDIVSRRFYPDDAALARLEQDVTTPWLGPTTERRNGSFTRTIRTRSYTVATLLDGTLGIHLRGPRAARLTLDVFSGSTRIGHAVKAAGSTSTSTALTICGQRSVGVSLTRAAGTGVGAFGLTVAKP